MGHCAYCCGGEVPGELDGEDGSGRTGGWERRSLFGLPWRSLHRLKWADAGLYCEYTLPQAEHVVGVLIAPVLCTLRACSRKADEDLWGLWHCGHRGKRPGSFGYGAMQCIVSSVSEFIVRRYGGGCGERNVGQPGRNRQ